MRFNTIIHTNIHTVHTHIYISITIYYNTYSNLNFLLIWIQTYKYYWKYLMHKLNNII